jgi:HEAT repeat protein
LEPGAGKGEGESGEAAGGFPDLVGEAIPDEEAMRLLASTVSGWLAEVRPTMAGPGSGGTGGGGGDGVGAGGNSTERRERFQQFVASLTRYMRDKSGDMMLLRNRLRDLGVSKDDLEELLEVAAWENLGLDDRIRKCLESTVVFELPPEKVLALILELLRLERPDDAARIVEKLGSGLFLESHEVRRAACDAFNRMTTWFKEPGLPPVIESLIERALLTHFVREKDPVIQQRTLPALGNLYDHWIDTQQIDKAYQTLRKVEAVAGAASEANPWKTDLLEELLEQLTSPERMSVLFAQMFTRDVETAATQYHPLLVFFGGRAALRLLDALAVEEDRGRRGRLIKALKTIGKPAIQHLRNALGSSTWYLVRNALNLIGDMMAMDLSDDVGETLKHDDDRVRRAAVRALGKIGGLRAERSLADALATSDGETRAEILTSLATMKADSVISEIMELAKPRRIGRGDDALRIRAIETAGQIGSNNAIAPLAELLRRKGLLGGQEPQEIRVAAAQALAAIGTPEAREALDAVLAAEPDNQLRSVVTRGAARRQ